MKINHSYYISALIQEFIRVSALLFIHMNICNWSKSVQFIGMKEGVNLWNIWKY